MSVSLFSVRLVITSTMRSAYLSHSFAPNLYQLADVMLIRAWCRR